MPTARRPAFADTSPDPRLECVLRRLVLFGALAVALLPAARGHSAWLGSLPLWLLAMPLSSWWALHRFRLPRLHAPAGAARRRRRGTVQARRQEVRRVRVRMAHAA